MVTKKEHAQRSHCPIACGLDLIGDHWTLIVVRDLMLLERHEFKELLAGEEGISSNILSDRLQRLQSNGLVNFIYHPNDKKRKLYYLTPKGKGLIHILIAVFQWSNTYLADHVLPPPFLKNWQVTNVADFIEQAMARLDRWEQSYGITH